MVTADSERPLPSQALSTLSKPGMMMLPSSQSLHGPAALIVELVGLSPEALEAPVWSLLRECPSAARVLQNIVKPLQESVPRCLAEMQQALQSCRQSKRGDEVQQAARRLAQTAGSLSDRLLRLVGSPGPSPGSRSHLKLSPHRALAKMESILSRFDPDSDPLALVQTRVQHLRALSAVIQQASKDGLRRMLKVQSAEHNLKLATLQEQRTASEAAAVQRKLQKQQQKQQQKEQQVLKSWGELATSMVAEQQKLRDAAQRAAAEQEERAEAARKKQESKLRKQEIKRNLKRRQLEARLQREREAPPQPEPELPELPELPEKAQCKPQAKDTPRKPKAGKVPKKTPKPTEPSDEREPAEPSGLPLECTDQFTFDLRVRICRLDRTTTAELLEQLQTLRAAKPDVAGVLQHLALDYAANPGKDSEENGEHKGNSLLWSPQGYRLRVELQDKILEDAVAHVCTAQVLLDSWTLGGVGPFRSNGSIAAPNP